MIGRHTDSGFDRNRTEEYKLSIQVSLDGFSFAIIHPNENRLLGLRYFPLTISAENLAGRRFAEWTENHELLRRKFALTHILYFTEKFTLVPGAFYDHQNQNKIANLVFGKQNGASVIENYIPAVSGNLLFYIPNELLNVLETKFPGHSLVHPFAALAPKMQELAEQQENTLALHFGNNSFALYLYLNGKLQVANSFHFFHPNDVIFYILSLLKQFEAPAGKTTLIAAGEIDQDGALYAAIQTYFGDTVFLTPEINYNPEVYKESLHRYFNLF